MPITIYPVDWTQPDQGEHIVRLLNEFACSPIAGGVPLPKYTRQNLVSQLQRRAPLVCLADCDGNTAGLAICLDSFSAFAARPLLNLHDLVVSQAYRRRGIGSALLKYVVEWARTRDYLKVTLEVRADNVVARRLYRDHGFSGTHAAPQVTTEYWVRWLHVPPEDDDFP